MADNVKVTAEIASRQSVIDIIRKVGEAQDAFAKQGAVSSKQTGEGFKKAQEHAGLVTTALGKIGAGLSAFGTAAGAAGLVAGAAAGAVYVTARSLKNMSVASLNLHYAAREMGVTPKDFVDLRQGLSRLGLSHAEAGDRLGDFFNRVRDIAQKGPGSQFFLQTGNFGEGSRQLREHLIRIYKTTGDGRAVVLAYVEAMRGATEYQRRQLAEAWGLPESVVNLADALARNREQLILNKEQAENYNNAYIDLTTNLENFKTKIGTTAIEQLNRLYRELDRRGVIADFGKALSDVVKVISDLLTNISPGEGETWKEIQRGSEEQKQWFRDQARKNWEAYRASPWWGIFRRQSYEESPEIRDYRSTGGPRAINVPVGGDQVQRASFHSSMEMRELLEVKKDSINVLTDIQLALGEGEGAGPGFPGGFPGGMRRGTYSGGGKVDMENVNPELKAVVEEAEKRGGLPPGYTFKYISGYRRGDSRFHGGLGTGKALATDIVIYDDKGRAIPNIGYGPGTEPYNIYSRFALAVRAAQMRMYPERRFIWGGHFRLGTPRDLMHMQWGGNSYWNFEQSQVAAEVQRQKQMTAESRESGGSVERGRAYIVGERGPELLVSPEHGQIYPFSEPLNAKERWIKSLGQRKEEDALWQQYKQTLSGLIAPHGIGWENWRQCQNIDTDEIADNLARGAQWAYQREALPDGDNALARALGYSDMAASLDRMIAERNRVNARVNLSVSGPPDTMVQAAGDGMFAGNVAMSREIKREQELVQ